MGPGDLTRAYRRDRRRLVEELRDRGIDDLTVLHAVATVPRHLFVPEGVRRRAYENVALPIGRGQTISRPLVHALHLSLAEFTGRERVLEVGTGSGYQTALLAQLADSVYSVERVGDLARRARRRLAELGVENVTLRIGDGSAGWPDEAPFDAVLVGAAAPEIPEALRSQLAPGGRLIIPVGDETVQDLWRVIRTDDGGWNEERIEESRFVPLLGEEGW